MEGEKSYSIESGSFGPGPGTSHSALGQYNNITPSPPCLDIITTLHNTLPSTEEAANSLFLLYYSLLKPHLVSLVSIPSSL